MRRWVLLEHAGEGITPHLDLMLERDAGEERRLVAFRLALGARLEAGEVLVCERLTDHRAAYLDFEGEIAGRGSVRRIAGGACSLQGGAECVEIRLERAGRWLRLRGAPVSERRERGNTQSGPPSGDGGTPSRALWRLTLEEDLGSGGAPANADHSSSKS